MAGRGEGDEIRARRAQVKIYIYIFHQKNFLLIRLQKILKKNNETIPKYMLFINCLGKERASMEKAAIRKSTKEKRNG
jgi:hypothetical protein